MLERIDLHLHTMFSDGRRTPAELADLLAAAGVTTAALTDHDTVEGIAPLEEALRGRGIRIIPGVEVSLEHEGQDLHILAYYLDRRNPALLSMLRRIRESRRTRICEIVARLNELGIPLTEAEVLEQAAGTESVGRVHVARAMVANEWVGHHSDVFRYYIGAEGPAYRPKRTVGLEACLAILREAGAVAVLAHPAAYRLEGVLDRLVAAGLEGLEVYHPSHGPEDVARFERLAGERRLLRTGGTDYHGDREGEMMPGTMGVDVAVLKDLEQRRSERLPEDA
jgi:hypothetical protein